MYDVKGSSILDDSSCYIRTPTINNIKSEATTKKRTVRVRLPNN